MSSFINKPLIDLIILIVSNNHQLSIDLIILALLNNHQPSVDPIIKIFLKNDQISIDRIVLVQSFYFLRNLSYQYTR